MLLPPHPVSPPWAPQCRPHTQASRCPPSANEDQAASNLGLAYLLLSSFSRKPPGVLFTDSHTKEAMSLQKTEEPSTGEERGVIPEQPGAHPAPTHLTPSHLSLRPSPERQVLSQAPLCSEQGRPISQEALGKEAAGYAGSKRRSQGHSWAPWGTPRGQLTTLPCCGE